jgi:hypothetical protein
VADVQLKFIFPFLLAFVLLLSLSGCSNQQAQPQTFPEPQQIEVQQPEASEPLITRAQAIPVDAVKISPANDIYPPQLHSDEYDQPVPVPGLVNTAGAEDSPFIMPDGNTLYFFFTPDVRVPVEKQLLDGVTGIWVSRKGADGSWGEPERVVLQDAGKLSLDGCEFVQENRMWFCSAREGYEGIHWFTADFIEGKWSNWQNADFNPAYEVGELHITADGTELYFHSLRAGGKGGLDLWVSRNVDGEWQVPENVAVLNTPENEGWPFVSQDGKPALIISQFAGEPSLDNKGNLYFVHHYYDNGTMLEADIYVARRK